MSSSLSQQKPYQHSCIKAFLFALITACVIFIPFMIIDKGYFFFYGDFNVQQIPFYKLAHEAVRTGDIHWNWYTDLGANFIGSYSFYLLGSPFFWLTIPFPTEFVPHLMAPLLILKHACAAATSCLYLGRFVKDKRYAVIGALLYAFSGFAVYNIFFNHFHEAIVFFPLLLVGIEELQVNNRRGIFAIAVAINAVVNYWFFIGEVVFVVIYFMIRSLSPDWRLSWKKFFWVAFEAVLGVLLSMGMLLPSVMAIMGNPRTSTSLLTAGWGFWLYWHQQLYPAIVSSWFFPPDLPSRPNFFPDRGAKWASLSAFLPLFSMTGVLAYIKSKKDWLRKILILCAVFALIPGLNSIFILFNDSYYARWFYMPVLLMALATIITLENRSIDLDFGFKWTAIFTAAVSAILAVTPKIVDGETKFGLTAFPERFAVTASITLIGLAVLILLVRKIQERRYFLKVITLVVCITSAVYSIQFIAFGKTHSNYPDFLRDTALDGRYELELPDDTFARSDFYDCMDNLGMYWHIPNIQAFHSIVPASLMDFYPKVGVKRDVSSKPEIKYYHLRSLLSVRWLFVDLNDDGEDLLPGFSYYDTQNGYMIYENEYFIPMGFTYDYYITVRELEKVDEKSRAAIMMRAIVLKDETEETNRDIIEHMPQEYYSHLTESEYKIDCENRRRVCGESFEIDNNGFTSVIDMPRENLVFYSVPYDEGWTATVNGEPAKIEKVNLGFMAVRAPAGENVEIRFDYRAPGLKWGMLASIGGIVLFAAYLLLYKRFGKPEPAKVNPALYGDFEKDLDYGAPVPEWLDQPEEDSPASTGEKNRTDNMTDTHGDRDETHRDE